MSGILTSYAIEPDTLTKSGALVFGRAVQMAVTVYKVGDRYLAASDHTAGYCNIEIVPEE